VLLPRGAPFPTRLENRGGHWKVFKLPFIVMYRTSEANAGKGGDSLDAVRPKPADSTLRMNTTSAPPNP
jgi:hypothetical protein